MCVHVFCAERLPDSTLVWVDGRSGHNNVYADISLATADGRLTAEGIRQVNAGLATLPGAPSLESAKPCHRTPL